jgi:tetratricopeptide (TPR) repeat protein
LRLSSRDFSSCTPLLAAGLGALLTRIRQKFHLILPGAVLSLFVLWNYLFLNQYYFHLVAWNRPLTFHEMAGDKFHILTSIERRRLVRTAYLSAQRGYMDDAEKAINLAIEIGPLHSDIYLAAGEIAASQNETDRAFRFLMQAHTLAPGDRDIERAIKKLGVISRMTIRR